MPSTSKRWHQLIPKSVSALREGYGLAEARADLFAGLTVAVVALPLSLALAVASGLEPSRGLFTAVVAGTIVSALGGSRYQIAGPTGAFVVVVAGIVQQSGYEGLVAATAMAGVLLVLSGFSGLGTYIKYVPFPVITGFTTGIAVVIFTSQIGELLGLTAPRAAGGALGSIAGDIAAIATFNPAAPCVALGTLAVAALARKLAPRAPAFLVAIAAAGLAAWALKLPVATIGSRFGGIPSSLPAPHLPDFAQARALLPAAFTIFALGGIESLLSAVVADGMTGRRHRANCELVAQGLANIATALMGGMPATGAIARTATNIRAGAKTPVAGIVHSLAILATMALLAPLGAYIPLASLAAVLAIVCWGMADLRVFAMILEGAPGDRAVLIATFLLTVFVDLSLAIAVGIVLAALVFTRDMSLAAGAVAVPETDDLEGSEGGKTPRERLPRGVEMFRLQGAFFFAAAVEFEEFLSRSGDMPKVLILGMADVPLIDASGAMALKRFIALARSRGVAIVLAELNPQPEATLRNMGVAVPRAGSFRDGIALARAFLPRPSAVPGGIP
ncbi:MAG TPA: SulP family inorganic anion transporter [Rhizomicrobium sp.]|nr:SulP family inorganic anion transporter [Rhizomicrobium sp.]